MQPNPGMREQQRPPQQGQGQGESQELKRIEGELSELKQMIQKALEHQAQQSGGQHQQGQGGYGPTGGSHVPGQQPGGGGGPARLVDGGGRRAGRDRLRVSAGRRRAARRPALATPAARA